MKNYSIWEDLKNEIKCQTLDKNLDCEVLIVGGGITGISILHQLRVEKVKAYLVERGKCGYGITSKSTAKITYLQEKIYMNIRNMVNEEMAALYLKSQRQAVNLLKRIIEENNINCDFTKANSYLFTKEEENIESIEEEYIFLKNNGVDVSLINKLPFKETCKKALMVSDTYLFHPLKYINFFKEKYQDYIWENTKLESFKKVNNYYECVVNGKIVKCKYLVIATHYPYFLRKFILPIKSYIETSFIGAKKVNDFKEISAINIDNPSISLRYHTDLDSNYLIYLFNSKKSADIKDFKDYFLELNKNNKFLYLWSNNDIITNDYIPFIGAINKDKTLLLATGYNTWGMTNGTIAGLVIKDIILNKPNPFIELFNPKRSLNLSKIVRFPGDIYGNVKAIVKSTDNNVNNKRVTNKVIDGKKVLIYKDILGKEHIVLNKCPHLKCGIVFNGTEKTWECLCHGSRFDLDGKCINGPSNFDITFK